MCPTKYKNPPYLQKTYLTREPKETVTYSPRGSSGRGSSLFVSGLYLQGSTTPVQGLTHSSGETRKRATVRVL